MATITHISQLNPDATYTYADYLTWRLEQAVELIRGKVLKMSPAPKTRHQKLSWKLAYQIETHLKKTKCDAFTAPFDVRLYDHKKSVKANKDIHTVVQPDLCIICDKNKIDENGCLGAPDLIVEILSKGNSRREMKIKYELYEEAGVREYWIADPDHQTMHIFVLDEAGKYKLDKIYMREDTMHSVIFPDLPIDLMQVFPEEEEE